MSGACGASHDTFSMSLALLVIMLLFTVLLLLLYAVEDDENFAGSNGLKLKSDANRGMFEAAHCGPKSYKI
jgi:hypothetical protein